MSVTRPLTDHLPKNGAAPVRYLAASPTLRPPAAASDVAAAMTDITSGALVAVVAAQYASIAWAGDRWLTGRAPTHPAVATLDALQATLGQGPCLDALRGQTSVTIGDTGSETRWPVFAARAAELGVRSMVSLPMSVRQQGFGVLNLYATRPHAFTGDDETAAAMFATRAAVALYRAAERDHVHRAVLEPATGIPTQRHHMSTAAVFGWLLRDSHRADLTLADRVRRLVKEHVRHDPAVGPSRTVERLDTVRGSHVVNGLDVTWGTIADLVVVRARGEVDLCTAPALTTALRAACVAVDPPGTLVIDLSGIRFLSAAGLTALTATRLHCRERQVELRLVATHRSVLLPLRITGLDAQFDIAPTLPAAARLPGA